MPRLAVLALAVACTASPTRTRADELAACQLISTDGDALARCLVMKYDWPADSARPAKYAWQWHLDSLRDEHERQVAALIAAQEEQERAAAAANQAAKLERLARLRPIADSIYAVCIDSANRLVDGLGLLDYPRWEPAMRRCRARRAQALH